MTIATCQPASPQPHRQTAAGACDAASRGAFSLVELLVVMSIMVIMVGLVGAAVSGARASSKKQQTMLLIKKLDVILRQQFATYASRTAPSNAMTDGFPSKAAFRSWHIRRNLITGDLPDRWSDVAAIATGTTLAYATSGGGSTSAVTFPITQPQQTYSAIWRGLTSAQQAEAPKSYAGAECLFMIIMQAGLANCLDCGELKTADRGDKDGDGLFEFWDAWGNPIGFILWPAGLQLPAGTGTKFFSGSRALESAIPNQRGVSPSPALGMRPLIYSAGPDGEYGLNRLQEAPNLLEGVNPVGRDCGNWDASSRMKDMAAPESSLASDNITNLDAEATQ